MKIKIKDQIIDSNLEPIMIIFDNQEDKKTHIDNLLLSTNGSKKYCVYPTGTPYEDIIEFMKTN